MVLLVGSLWIIGAEQWAAELVKMLEPWGFLFVIMIYILLASAIEFLDADHFSRISSVTCVLLEEDFGMPVVESGKQNLM